MSKTGLQQIDQDSRTHHETKTRLLEEIFTSSKSGTQFRDSIPGSRDWHFSIPKSRDWKRRPGLQSLVRPDGGFISGFTFTSSRSSKVNKQDGDDNSENCCGIRDYIRLFCRVVPQNISPNASSSAGHGTFKKICRRYE